MRKAVRAVVINDNKLLVMHRNKFGNKYNTLPGGNIEVGESPEQALYRELFEETQITVTEPRLVFVEHAGDPYGDQYVFLCKFVSGEPRLLEDSEEFRINKMGQNLYTPMWVDLGDLTNTGFLSEKLKTEILQCYANGWPESPVEIQG